MYVQLFETETTHPSFVWQLLRALVADAMTAADTDSSRVDEPDELLAAARANLGCIVLATAYHSSHPQLAHLSLDLTVHHNTSTRCYSSGVHSSHLRFDRLRRDFLQGMTFQFFANRSCEHCFSLLSLSIPITVCWKDYPLNCLHELLDWTGPTCIHAHRFIFWFIFIFY